ncbi:MAG TPA: hypothetical protein HA272_01925 [Methanoregula sp.]|nr:hypothetical protein [Methanoregula sp.]
MSSKSEYKGKWWIPSNAPNEIDGTLKINSDGTGSLDLRGELIQRDFSEFPPISEDVEIILGRASDGSKITLNNCHLHGTSHSPEGFPTQSFIIQTNLFDVHFSSKDAISFRKIKIEFKHFEYLIKSTRIQVNKPLQDANILTINNVTNEKIPFFSVDGFNIEIIIDVHPNITTFPRRKIIIEETPYISIETDIGRKHEDFLKIIDKLQYFFSFCLSKIVYPVNVYAESEASIWEPPDDWNVKDDTGVIYEPIQIISHWVDLPDQSQIEEVDRNEILFTLNDIRDNFDFVMNKWWIKNEVFKSVFDIYFGTIFNSRMYLENTYLSLAQCIESYHRKSSRFLDYHIHPEEYAERIGILKNFLKNELQLTSSQKKSLISTLKMGNSLSLENRIQQLLITYPTITPFIAGSEKNFPNTIALNRNNLTHLDPKPEIKYATFEELNFFYQSE